MAGVIDELHVLYLSPSAKAFLRRPPGKLASTKPVNFHDPRWARAQGFWWRRACTVTCLVLLQACSPPQVDLAPNGPVPNGAPSTTVSLVNPPESTDPTTTKTTVTATSTLIAMYPGQCMGCYPY